MRKLLLNLFALFLLPHDLAAQAAEPKLTELKPPAPAYELNDLQKARLDVARQKVFRWQDKVQEALGEFSAVCIQAQKENHWPAVQCSLNDLTVERQPTAPAPQPPAPPPQK
jgi:hypothetical protein